MSLAVDNKRSVLLQLARDSIHEVLEAKNSIDKTALAEKDGIISEKDPAILQ